MRMLIMVLTGVSLIACEGKNAVVFQEAPGGNLTSVEKTIEPGTFTSTGLKFCTDGQCMSVSAPPACAGVTLFNDFTIVDQNTATFFASILEPVVIDHELSQIALVSNSTLHQGLVIGYKYIAHNIWEITYGPNCSRLYKKL